MEGISSRAAGKLQNKDKTFQGQKFDDDLDIDYIEFKYRNHDPQIGRFIEIDPLSDKYVSNSTYAFSENCVTGHRELEGLERVPVTYGDKNEWQGDSKLVERGVLDPVAYNQGYERIVMPAIKGLVSGTIIGNLFNAYQTFQRLIEVEDLKSQRNELSNKNEDLQSEIKQLERSNKTYEKRIDEHQQKLEDYKNNPEKFDNKNILEGKTPEQRQQIIDGRVKKLEHEIKQFENNVDKNKQQIQTNQKQIEDNKNKINTIDKKIQ